MGLANQELIEEMFYGRRSLLEEIRGQRQENFLIVGPRKIGKTSLLQRVRFELEQQGYRVIPVNPGASEVLGQKIEIVSADHQNKPDLAAAIGRRWYEVEGVDMITELTTSSVALAVHDLSKQMKKIDIVVGQRLRA